MKNLTVEQKAKQIFKHIDQKRWESVGGGEIVAELYYQDKEGNEVFVGELFGSNGTREEAYTQEIEDKSDKWIKAIFWQMEKDGCFEHRVTPQNSGINTRRRRK